MVQSGHDHMAIEPRSLGDSVKILPEKCQSFDLIEVGWMVAIACVR